jgi:hypothetical protein
MRYKKYSVWVGGIEVNDYYLSKTQADEIALQYRQQGYDDVAVINIYEIN